MAAAADVPSPPRWLGTLVVIPLLGLIAAALIALRIMERGEIWLDRTYWLVSHAALGGLAGAALVKLAQRWITWSFVRKNPRIIAAMLFAAGFMAAMMAAYVIHYILLTGQIEAREDRPFYAWFWISAEVGALFLISCPAYLLPWPLPVMMLAAGWLLPAESREESGKAARNG